MALGHEELEATREAQDAECVRRAQSQLERGGKCVQVREVPEVREWSVVGEVRVVREVFDSFGKLWR